MPRYVFIPTVGGAEFTMGFGLLWTPLIRRLSAIALIVIFTAAVWPFGRVDLIGHGLTMAILVAVASDQCRVTRFLPSLKVHLPAIPGGIASALVVFATAYWGCISPSTEPMGLRARQPLSGQRIRTTQNNHTGRYRTRVSVRRRRNENLG